MQDLLTNLMIFGWIPAVVVLFSLMPARNAVLWGYFLAAMFLPMRSFDFPGIPNLDKFTATAYGVLIGTAIFDYARITLFRPKWIDLPIVMFTVLGPVGASLTNAPLGPYDAVSSAFDWSVTWLLPWFIGRLYFKTLRDVQVLAMTFLAAALVYVPICWFELRFSPQLHRWIYGFHQTNFIHAIRFFGFRPRGFMQSELMLGLWISASALLAFCMWRGRFDFKLGRYRVPPAWAFAVLVPTAFICQTVGAFVLAFGGGCLLVASVVLRTRVFLIALLLAAPTFMVLRGTGLWDMQNVVEAVAQINEDKAGSLEFRVRNDNLLAAHAMERPVFGWGGWKRNLVLIGDGSHNKAVTDGMWIILFGKMGVVGLGGFVLALALPTILFVRRYAPSQWLTPAVAPVTGLAIMLSLYQLDCLLNAMENPIYLLIAGGMAGFLVTPQPFLRRVARPAAAPRRREPPARASESHGAHEPHGLHPAGAAGAPAAGVAGNVEAGEA